MKIFWFVSIFLLSILILKNAPKHGMKNGKYRTHLLQCEVIWALLYQMLNKSCENFINILGKFSCQS